MNQVVKLFVSSFVIVILLLVIGVVVYMSKFFFQFKDAYNRGVSDTELIDKQVEYTKNINIDFNVSNVRLEKSDDNNIRVRLFSDNPESYNVDLKDGVLNIELKEKEEKNSLKTYHRSSIIIELPNDSESNITIKGNVGEVYIEELPNAYVNLDLDVCDVTIRDIGEVVAKVNVGDIILNNINKALNVDLDTGDVIIDKVRLEKDSSIKVKMGDVSIDQNKNFKIDAKTNMGDVSVSGSNSDADITLSIRVDVGDISVYNIKTSYERIGDIELFHRIKLENVENVEITTYTEAGKDTKTYTSNEELLYYYNKIGNTKLGEITEESCEDNVTVYTFNTKNIGKVNFEFECNNYLYNNYKYKVIE